MVTLAQLVLLSISSYLVESLMVPKGVCDEIEGLVRHFIWGSSGGSRKTTLVSWDAICQPRSFGGFGFQHLSD